MASTDLPDAPPSAAGPDQQDRQEQHDAPTQIQQAAAGITTDAPFCCCWQGCRERTQSAEALYVRAPRLDFHL